MCIILERKINCCTAFGTTTSSTDVSSIRRDNTQENILKGTILYYRRHGVPDLAGLFHLLFLWLCEKQYKCIMEPNIHSLRSWGTQILNRIIQFCLLRNSNCVLLEKSGRKRFLADVEKKPLFVLIQLGTIFTSAKHLKLHLKSIEAASAQHFWKSSPLGTGEEQRARNLCLR